MHANAAPISPSTSVRKLNLFTPLGSPVSSYTSMTELASGPSSPATSPLRTASPSSRFSTGSNFSNLSFQLRSNIRNLVTLRRQPSAVELALEEEQRSCKEDLLAIVEPRPTSEAHVSGIEEVLFGRL